MKPIARDTSDFPDLRKGGCIYVDKTAWFHRLLTDPGAKCFFLARPRRFGKSLMISAFKAIFQGRRDLFDGLAISKTDWSWETFPVLHFNFAGLSTTTLDRFDGDFADAVRASLAEAGCGYDDAKSPGRNFVRAAERLA